MGALGERPEKWAGGGGGKRGGEEGGAGFTEIPVTVMLSPNTASAAAYENNTCRPHPPTPPRRHGRAAAARGAPAQAAIAVTPRRAGIRIDGCGGLTGGGPAGWGRR